MNSPTNKSAVTFPVDAILPRLLTMLAEHPVAILEAPPGAGKTTRVPPGLLDLPGLGNQSILMLEPRRIAAVNAADFMARQRGEKVGQTVGYTIRYERRVSAATRIEVVTEGVLTRRLQSDPELNGVGVVIFDEFHERNLHSDLALAFCLDARKGLRPDLKVVIMSATLDSHDLAVKLGDAPVVRSEGRFFPVETIYSERDATPGSLVREAVLATGRAVRETEGDILVFMPGRAEIDRTVRALRSAHPEVAVCPLYGGLPLADQRRAIEPGKRRKVVVATNVAETSLTIEGVRTVVDGGFERRPRFDAARGLTTLETARISLASAKQRLGRAGRLAPGFCFRLWREGTDGALLPQAPAEITVADLAPLALELAHWGITDVGDLVWTDPPPAGHLAAARKLLQQLGALDDHFRLTDSGRTMADLPAHPRHGRILTRALAEKCPELGSDLVAVLDEGIGRGSNVDLVAGLNRIQERTAGAAIIRAARFWRQRLGCSDRPVRVDREPVARLLAVAWPDHIARRRDGRDLQYLLANGMAAELDAASPLRGADFLAVADLYGKSRTEVKITAALPLPAEDVEELFGTGIDWQRRIEWDEERQQATAREVRAFGAIELQSRPAELDPDDLRQALLGWVQKRGLDALAWSKDAVQLRARLCFAASQLADAGFPDCRDEALLADLPHWLEPYLVGIRSVAQLKKIDLREALLARLDWSARKRLDELAPERLRVPGGSNVRIDYSGEQPVLAVKLQELFGLIESPRLAGGRVPVLIHLLSPAGRPLQVTGDLKSFWENGYPEVKREMKGRYPKHPWPDDPLTAEPTRKTKRQKK